MPSSCRSIASKQKVFNPTFPKGETTSTGIALQNPGRTACSPSDRWHLLPEQWRAARSIIPAETWHAATGEEKPKCGLLKCPPLQIPLSTLPPPPPRDMQVSWPTRGQQALRAAVNGTAPPVAALRHCKGNLSLRVVGAMSPHLTSQYTLFL